MSPNPSISRIFTVLLVMVFMLSVTPLQVARAAGIRYAMPVASGSGDCFSWADACTLQTALTGATGGDEIWVAGGMYKPTTDPTNRFATFQLISGVALYGGFAGTETELDQRNLASNLTILSGDIDNNDSQTPIITDAFTVAGNTNNSYHVLKGATGARLDGFTITAGYSDYFNGANCPGTNCGGGMLNSSCSSLTLTNLTFSGNSAGYGGGMYNWNSSLTLTNSTFIGNSATTASGGGLLNYDSNLTLTNATFIGNTAAAFGGGIFNGSGSPTLTNVTFSGNSAGYGGGMYDNTSSPTLTNATFSGNSAQYGGGGMYNSSSSSPTLMNVTFTGNSTRTKGGGMYNDSSSPALTNVTFSGNSADYAGGLYNTSSSAVLVNVTIGNNSASTDGGGIFNYYSNSTLTNVTFRDNTAHGAGGGMLTAYSDPILTNVTVSGNSAGTSGGGLYNSSGSPQIRNAIFWGNMSSDSSKQIYSNTLVPLVLNDSIMQDGCPAFSICTNILTADPELGTLGDYGGFTQTIPILAGSSAIDTGNDSVCPATDQRGVSRPQGSHCDIGSFEFNYFQILLPLSIR